MSLQNIANHLAQQGRGNDKMLVHMSPQEVGTLTKLAQSKGMAQLPRNPQTGLPEASFLDSILPTVLGAGLSYLTDGAVSPAMLGLGVGAASAVASGSIQKGLMAGLGAYGGAGIEAGLAGLGSADIGTNALADAQANYAANVGDQAVGTSGYEGLTKDEYLQQQVGNKMAAATPFDKLSAGASSAFNNPSGALSALGGTKGAITTGLAALAPMMTASQPTTSMPNTSSTSPTAYVQTKMVNPYTHQVYDISKVPASQYSGTRQDQINNADLSVFGLAHGGAVKHFDDGGAASDPALAAYQSGDYSTALQDIQNAGMSAQDVVSKYGLNADQAAQVAQNLGYTGDLSGLNYGAPAAATTPSISASFFQPGGQGAQIAAQEAANVTAGAPASTAPAYTNYTADQYASFFADPKNAAVLNTPGGLAAAEATYHADPNAVTSYLQQNADKLNLSAGDLYQINAGQGVQGVYNSMDSWVAAHPNATGADITAALQSSGLNQNDVQNYFNRPNSAYGTNVATGKAFTGAGDIYTIGQNQGFSNINTNIDQWIKDHPATTTSLAQAQAAMSQYGINETDVERATGKTSAQLYQDLKKQQPVINTGGGGGTGGGGASTANPATYANNAIQNTPASTLKPGVSGITGPGIEGGGTVVNANGTITESPVLPGIPQGGFTGMGNLLDTYTKGGGNTGYVSPTVSSMDEFNSKYNTLSGGTKAAYDYLMGAKGAAYPISPSTPGAMVAKPYYPAAETGTSQQRIIFDPNTGRPMLNPNYKSTSSTSTSSSSSTGAPPSLKLPSGVTTTATAYDGYYKGSDGNFYDKNGNLIAATEAQFESIVNPTTSGGANGGLMGMAHGGMADQHYNLGGYSDGGRLLRGPGDGVSDDIPATIGHKQPARLADGEFVVPARIVSELGNGSTEAGARQLYAMMDRIQKARGKTVGKNRVAADTKSSKYLPA